MASGHSNPEIAATLFISSKTVEANLSRIYRELGIRGRVDLARHSISWNKLTSHHYASATYQATVRAFTRISATAVHLGLLADAAITLSVRLM